MLLFCKNGVYNGKFPERILKMINVAILGFGVVGSGVAEVLTQNKKIIENKLSKEVNIKYILDLRDFPGNPFEKLVVHDFNIILNDPEVTVVAEMMGGSHPAYDFSKACLEAGKSVVTSNKEVVANFGAELLRIAKAHGVAYLFEASVGGGIPIIRPMCNDLASNNITEINGILNGTTNYILTKMTTEGADFADVLKDAQDKGYAERNPAADVEGLDAARKIVILAALAFGKAVSPNDIHVEGITDIATEDVEIANSLGYSIKLIGHAEKIDGKIGPESIGRMFSDDVVVRPTPTPSPTPTPTPSPTPTATPKPTPAPSATPRAEGAPIELESAFVYVGDVKRDMVLGRDEEGELLYPLCGVMGWLDYQYTYEGGSWQLLRAEDGAEIALMTDGQDGLCVGAMGAYNGVIFLADDSARVYVYGGEAYVTDDMLSLMGADVLLVEGVPVIVG